MLSRVRPVLSLMLVIASQSWLVPLAHASTSTFDPDFKCGRDLPTITRGIKDAVAAGYTIPNATVLGISNPNETVTLGPNDQRRGDWYLFNNARLNVTGGAPGITSLAGNIFLVDHSAFSVTNADLYIAQEFSGQYNLAATDDASVSITDSKLTLGNTPLSRWAPQLCGRSHATFKRNDLTVRGVGNIDPYLSETATVVMEDSKGEAEITADDGASVTVNNMRDRPVGLYFNVRGTIPGTVTMPGGPNVTQTFQLPPDGTGRAQSASITNSNVYFGVWVEPGADLTLADSTTAIFLRFHGSASVTSATYKGLFADQTLRLSDRRIRLINTRLWTMNMYQDTKSGGTLTATDSVLGEHVCTGATGTRCVLRNTIVDGSGGSLNAHGGADLDLQGGRVTTYVTATDQSVIHLRGSDVSPAPADQNRPTPWLQVVDSALISVEDTSLAPGVDLRIRDNGALAFAWLETANGASVSGQVAIYGAAAVFSAPTSPHAFTSYVLSFKQVGSSANPTTIATGTQMNWSTPLGTWNTAGLGPGQYDLRLDVKGGSGIVASVSRRVTVG